MPVTVQLQLARSNGLPAVRMGELLPHSAELASLARSQRSLTASLLRSWLTGVATTGTLALGTEHRCWTFSYLFS